MLPHADQPYHTPRWCRPQSRCRAWRHCLTCARIRQAKIASAAERLARIAPEIHWSALHPARAGADEAIRARREWVELVAPRAAIWTVEQSPSTGALHINILHPAAPAPALVRSHLWTKPLAGDLRRVGAYISKPDQYPRKADYPGRLYGTCGPLWQYLAHPEQKAPVAAAALQYTIDPEPMQLQAFLAQGRRERLNRHALPPPDAAPPMSKEDARTIAARWLPDILENLPRPPAQTLPPPKDRQ